MPLGCGRGGPPTGPGNGDPVGQATAPLGFKLHGLAMVPLADRRGFRHYSLSPKKWENFLESKFQCCPSLGEEPAGQRGLSEGPSPAPRWRLPPSPASRRGDADVPSGGALGPQTPLLKTGSSFCPEGSEGGCSCPQFPGVSLHGVGRGPVAEVCPGRLYPARPGRGTALLPNLPGTCAGGGTARPGSCCWRAPTRPQSPGHPSPQARWELGVLRLKRERVHAVACGYPEAPWPPGHTSSPGTPMCVCAWLSLEVTAVRGPGAHVIGSGTVGGACGG